MASKPRAQKKATKGRGHFFSIERQTWERICESLSCNAAVAFLVLASGSGADNITTSWSAKAVNTYTGMSWARAKDALSELCRMRYLEVVKAGSKPQYKIRNQQKNSKKQVEAPDRIWLPNAIVTAARNELSPLARLRATQDIHLLRLFIDLYGAHNLLDEGGISRTVLHRRHERTEIGKRGQYVVYGFTTPRQTTAYLGSEVLKPHDGNEKSVAEFWERLATLEAYGLFKWVTYLCETDVDGGGELIHPCMHDAYGAHDEAPTIEKQIGAAAHEAADAMVDNMIDDGYGGAANRRLLCRQMVPVLQQFRQATLIDIALLTYRPRTGPTSIWRARLENEAAWRLEDFQLLKEKFSPEGLKESALI
jgi:hypothetical protein